VFIQQIKYTIHESNQKVFYKINKTICVVFNLGFVRAMGRTRRGFGRVKSRARLRTANDECVAPATNCGLRELRRRTATNDGVEKCTGELERWGELG
jgi:hypothetical protein